MRDFLFQRLPFRHYNYGKHAWRATRINKSLAFYFDNVQDENISKLTEQGKCYGNIIIPVHCDDIEQLLLHKEYKDGDCLPSERVLATQYGVSRNVIREAIKILTEKKLVTNVIGKGNYVTLPNETDLVDMVESALNTSASCLLYDTE